MDGFMILGIVLLAAGFLFVGIETLIPGFGAPGILGGCCLVAGVFLIADSVQEAWHLRQEIWQKQEKSFHPMRSARNI